MSGDRAELPWCRVMRGWWVEVVGGVLNRRRLVGTEHLRHRRGHDCNGPRFQVVAAAMWWCRVSFGMENARDWMTLTLSAPDGAAAGPVCPASAVDLVMRPLTPDDADGLARLMLESYRGSVDDSGETLDDARKEVARLIAGDFGSMDWEASLVMKDQDELVSATIITRDRVAPPPLVAGEAFLAFSMTAPKWKRRGLARLGLVRVITMLRRRGEPRLHLVVTRANAPAVALYRDVGFVNGPIGEGSGVGRSSTL